MKVGIRVGFLFCFMVTMLSGCSSSSNDSAGVSSSSERTVSVIGIDLDKERVTIGINNTEQLTATIVPENATNSRIVWASDNEAVATVDASGRVQAFTTGNAYITATTEDGAFEAECPVTVIIPVESITLNCPDGRVVLRTDDPSYYQMATTILPENATRSRERWYSTDPVVATVGKMTINAGRVTPLVEGETTIIVKSFPSGETAQCQVVVLAPEAPTPPPAAVITPFLPPLPEETTIPGLELIPGATQDFQRGSLAFRMLYMYAPQYFPTGENDQNYSPMQKAYWLGETEVTYDLWFTVLTWATTNAGGGTRVDGGPLYSFYWRGAGGSDGVTGEPPTDENAIQPVTHIGWREAMVWTNALTEYYNAHRQPGEPAFTCAYYSDFDRTTPIRATALGSELNHTPGSQDNPYVLEDSTGFRLPTSMEWELAARFRGSQNSNAISGDFNVMYTKGNSASHAWTFHNDDAPYSPTSDRFAGQQANLEVAVYARLLIGNVTLHTGVTGTAPVATKLPNTLGFYDMSGNVAEFCFDWVDPDHPQRSHRVIRGGAWGTKDPKVLNPSFMHYYPDKYFGDSRHLQIGAVWGVHPGNTSPWTYSHGFRVARSVVN